MVRHLPLVARSTYIAASASYGEPLGSLSQALAGLDERVIEVVHAPLLLFGPDDAAGSDVDRGGSRHGIEHRPRVPGLAESRPAGGAIRIDQRRPDTGRDEPDGEPRGGPGEVPPHVADAEVVDIDQPPAPADTHDLAQ